MPQRNSLFRLAPLALAAHLIFSGPAAAQGAPGTQGAVQPAANPALAAQIDERAKAIEDKLIAWRRDIHQHPELGNQEHRTSKLVADHLRALGMDVTVGEDGWREPSLVHSAANAPAKTMMNTGLIDCTQVGGNSQPKRLRSRRASA